MQYLSVPYVFALFLAALLLVSTSQNVYAQNGVLPDMPTPVEAMAEQGAQVRYLGREEGVDGWITILRGQEQYFYILPNGGFVMGLLFDEEGEAITVEQVRRLQESSGGVLDMFAADKQQSDPAPIDNAAKNMFEFQTPAKTMFSHVERSNWITLGQDGAPIIYSFLDPQCGHCHTFIKEIKDDYIEKGRVQVRMIPVGFTDMSLAQAAFLLASPDAKERFYEHLDGDTSALPAKNNFETRGVQRNMSLMGRWKFDVTPLSVYKTLSGDIKIIRGGAKDMEQILLDMRS